MSNKLFFSILLFFYFIFYSCRTTGTTKIKEPPILPVETPAVQTVKKSKFYTVRLNRTDRDSLWKIAGYDHIYDDSLKWKLIYEANKSKIKNPNLIYPGQVLTIPPDTKDFTDD